MSAKSLMSVSIAALVGATLCCSGTVWAQGASATQDSDLEEITVTGSRVITDNLRSPTPITTLTAEEITRTTPSDIPDAPPITVATC